MKRDIFTRKFGVREFCNVRNDELNHRLGYDIVNLYNQQNNFTRGVIGDRRACMIICSDDSTGLSWYVIDSTNLRYSMSLKWGK